MMMKVVVVVVVNRKRKMRCWLRLVNKDTWIGILTGRS